MTEAKKQDYYYLLIKYWFFHKKNDDLTYVTIDATPLFDPLDSDEKNDYYEVAGGVFKLDETEKAVKFRVPTLTYSGDCASDMDLWFPKSVVKYGQNE